LALPLGRPGRRGWVIGYIENQDPNTLSWGGAVPGLTDGGGSHGTARYRSPAAVHQPHVSARSDTAIWLGNL